MNADEGTTESARDSQLEPRVQDQPSSSRPNDLNTTKSVTNSKQSSIAWKYFERKSHVTACCTICNKVCKHSGNTTNLIQHLKRCHAVVCSALIAQKHKWSATSESSDESINDKNCPQQKCMKIKKQGKLTRIDEAFERTNSFREGGEASDKITNAILYMIAHDKMPLSTVHNEGFKLLTRTVSPRYTVPSRKTIARLIDARYDDLKERFVAKLHEAQWYSITCDNWTDVSNQSYLGVTIHYLTKEMKMKNGCIGVFPMNESHTSEHLTDFLKSVIEDFKLELSKITTVITDSAANIKKAMRDLLGQDKQLGCVAHTLSHLVPDVLAKMPAVQDTIAKVKAVVTITRRSVVASDELKKLQMRDGKTHGTALKFIQAVPIRWNSTLCMLQRFLTLEEYVYPVVSKCPNAPDMLRRDEMQMLRDVVSLMKLVELAITEVSGALYPTCSVIISLVHCLKDSIQRYKPLTQCGNEFQEKLLATIDWRFKDFEFNKILAISSLLDPRFKKIHFQSTLAASTAITWINNFIKNDEVQITNTTAKVLEEPTEQHSLWSHHDHLIASKADSNRHSEDVSLEIRQHLSQPKIKRYEDPFQYWSSIGKLAFPSLYKLAVKYISIVGTSVPSERIFSQAGNLKTDNRSRLSGEHLNKLLFLSSLSREDWSFEPS